LSSIFSFFTHWFVSVLVIGFASLFSRPFSSSQINYPLFPLSLGHSSPSCVLFLFVSTLFFLVRTGMGTFSPTQPNIFFRVSKCLCFFYLPPVPPHHPPPPLFSLVPPPNPCNHPHPGPHCFPCYQHEDRIDTVGCFSTAGNPIFPTPSPVCALPGTGTNTHYFPLLCRRHVSFYY